MNEVVFDFETERRISSLLEYIAAPEKELKGLGIVSTITYVEFDSPCSPIRNWAVENGHIIRINNEKKAELYADHKTVPEASNLYQIDHHVFSFSDNKARLTHYFGPRFAHCHEMDFSLDENNEPVLENPVMMWIS